MEKAMNSVNGMHRDHMNSEQNYGITSAFTNNYLTSIKIRYMFTHFEPNKKCEWFGGNLAYFIGLYNVNKKTHYQLDNCLDKAREGGSPEAEPEVRVVGEKGETPMVIERKSLAPEFYFQHHEHMHRFAETLEAQIDNRFSKGPYQLTIQASTFRNLKKRQVVDGANEMAARLLADFSGKPIGATKPVTWSFSSLRFEDTIKGVRIQIDEDDYDFLNAHVQEEKDRSHIQEELSRHFGSFERKMRKYDNHRKLLVLEVYGASWLTQPDVKDMIAAIGIPSCVDEVWLAEPEWISEDEYQIEYSLVAPDTHQTVRLSPHH